MTQVARVPTLVAFRTWAFKAKQDFHVAELCMSHTLKDKIARTYINLADMMPNRAEVMQTWSEELLGNTRKLSWRRAGAASRGDAAHDRQRPSWGLKRAALRASPADAG